MLWQTWSPAPPASTSGRCMCPDLRACAAATRTTPGCARFCSGSRRSRSKKASRELTRGSRHRLPVPWASPRWSMRWRERSTPSVPRVNVLGVEVSVLDMDRTLDILDCWITEGHQEYVCVTGVHGVMESRRDERLRHIHNDAGLVTADGMPLVWWS